MDVRESTWPSREAAMISAAGPTWTSRVGGLTMRYCNAGSRLTVGAASAEVMMATKPMRVEHFMFVFLMRLEGVPVSFYTNRRGRRRNGAAVPQVIKIRLLPNTELSSRGRSLNTDENGLRWLIVCGSRGGEGYF